MLGGWFSEGRLTPWSFWYLHTDISTDYISILSQKQKGKFTGSCKLEQSRGKSCPGVSRSRTLELLPRP